MLPYFLFKFTCCICIIDAEFVSNIYTRYGHGEHSDFVSVASHRIASVHVASLTHGNGHLASYLHLQLYHAPKSPSNPTYLRITMYPHLLSLTSRLQSTAGAIYKGPEPPTKKAYAERHDQHPLPSPAYAARCGDGGHVCAGDLSITATTNVNDYVHAWH